MMVAVTISVILIRRNVITDGVTTNEYALLHLYHALPLVMEYADVSHMACSFIFTY